MRTLHVGLRVSDLERSLAFYTAVGYAVIGTAFGTLTMLQLPGGSAGPRTCWITDPDGYRIEVLQWPEGHADGITKADFA